MICMKLWIDDVREAPDGYVWSRSVNDAKKLIQAYELFHAGKMEEFEDFTEFWVYRPMIHMMGDLFIDIDHDAGDYAWDGGDYIKLLDWLEETNRKYPIRIHSQNPVGVENMRRIIERNGWREVR